MKKQTKYAAVITAMVLFLLVGCAEEQGVVEEEQSGSLALAALPALSMTENIKEGMSYADVVGFLGPPIQRENLRVSDEAREATFIWGIEGERRYVEVVFYAASLNAELQVASVTANNPPESRLSRHSSGAGEVTDSEVVLHTEYYENEKESFEIIPVSYRQDEDSVVVYCEFANPFPFDLRIGDETLFFNGEELSRLDWSFSFSADANSTRTRYFRVYRIVEPGDRIDVCGTLYDNYSNELDEIGFSAVFPEDEEANEELSGISNILQHTAEIDNSTIEIFN
ncbi:MAG: hypothetical protein FWG42_04665 [Clostridiales bacterium]|nr:hypothetical protein [Clostridiales bacterium]